MTEERQAGIMPAMMTGPQWASVVALGRAFHHFWCREDRVAIAQWRRCATEQELDEVYDSALTPGYPRCLDGGVGPGVDHETQSGRVRWSVLQDGSVDVTVTRPSGPVIEANVTRRRVRITWASGLATGPLAIEERHVDALNDVVEALTCERPVTLDSFPERRESALRLFLIDNLRAGQ